MKIKPAAFRKPEKKSAETQIFYGDEIEAIIQYSISKANEKKDVSYFAIPLFFYSGLRLGECLGLQFSDCCREDHSIYVHQMLAVNDKRLPDGTWEPRRYEIVDFLKGNGDPRTIMISDQGFDIIDMIRDMHKRNGIITPLLFPGVQENKVQRKLYGCCKDLGIIERSPHKWRKTYISTLLNNGVDADFVRRQVGHKDLQTTYNSYTFSTTRKEEQLGQLNKVLAVQSG